MRGAVIDIKAGQCLTLDVQTPNGVEQVSISLEQRANRAARFRVSAPDSVTINRPKSSDRRKGLTNRDLVRT